MHIIFHASVLHLLFYSQFLNIATIFFIFFFLLGGFGADTPDGLRSHGATWHICSCTHRPLVQPPTWISGARQSSLSVSLSSKHGLAESIP